MKKEVKSDIGLNFVSEYLGILINSCSCVIARDSILYEHIMAAHFRVDELICPSGLGDIVDDYVVRVFENNE